MLAGFEAGTDDYISKPFDLNIFLARLNGLLRRSRWNTAESSSVPDVLKINGRTVDLENLELRNGDEIIHLTDRERDMMRLLAATPGALPPTLEMEGSP